MILKKQLSFIFTLLLLASVLTAEETSPSRKSHLKVSSGLDYFNHVTTSHFKTSFGDIGFNVGIQFDIKKRHSIQLLSSIVFNAGEPFLSKQNLTMGAGTTVRNYSVESSFDFVNTLEIMLGYGFIMRLFRKIYIRPSVFFGYSFTNFRTRHNAWDTTVGKTHIIYPTDGKTGEATHFFLSPQVVLLTDIFINNYNKRFSYYATIGYKLMLKFLEDRWSYNELGGSYSSSLISGLIIRFSVAYTIL